MFLLVFALFPLLADLPMPLPQEEPQEIVVNNRILAKVREKTISVIDVMKQMDVYLSRFYPQLSNSKAARYQFYMSQWKETLDHMINSELMMADAESREVKVSDGEVRETLQDRFGPNIMGTLNKLGISLEEARKMIQEELIVQRMNWIRVTSKAIQKVNLQDVKNAYQEYCKEHPAKETWKYQVLSIRSPDEKASEELAQKAFLLLQKEPDLAAAAEKLKSEAATITLSPEYQSDDKELSSSHKEVLASLAKGEFSKPTLQKSRDNSVVFRIFHLKDHSKTDLPKFDDIANQLRENLLQRAAGEEMAVYVSKLRSRFNYNNISLEENIPSDFEPFSVH